jgi:hypothetical protein
MGQPARGRATKRFMDSAVRSATGRQPNCLKSSDDGHTPEAAILDYLLPRR